MKTLRSILGILCGAALAVVVIIVAESINGIVYKPDDGRTFAQFQEDLQKDMKAMKAWVESLPQSAMVVVLLGWEVGAFLGGGLAALVAGHWRRLHAGVIGTLVLAATAFNFYIMKTQCDISHPDYMIILGLLLPLPASLLGGQIVDMCCPCTTAGATHEMTSRPVEADGAIREGDPPMRQS